MCMIECAERYDVFRKEQRRARVAHLCYDCGRTISAGESYQYSTGLYDGHWDTIHTCAHCVWAAEWLVEQCGGYLFGGIREDLEEHWNEEPLLRSQALGRRIILMRRHWRDKLGNLIPVPA